MHSMAWHIIASCMKLACRCKVCVLLDITTYLCFVALSDDAALTLPLLIYIAAYNLIWGLHADLFLLSSWELLLRKQKQGICFLYGNNHNAPMDQLRKKLQESSLMSPLQTRSLGNSISLTAQSSKPARLMACCNKNVVV